MRKTAAVAGAIAICFFGISCRNIILPASNNTLGIEHPLALDGTWQIAFDPENIGEEEGWFKEQPVDVDEIAVPGPWQQAKCGAGYEGIAWYYRKFDLPEDAPEHVEIHFADVNYRAKIWLNGEFIGEHEGACLPFSFDIGSAARRGLPNLLVVRVVDPPRLAWADGLNLYDVPHGKEDCFVNCGGICGPVQLVTHGDVWLRDVFLVPDLQAGTITARCRIACADSSEPVMLLATAADAADIGVEYGSFRQEIAPGTAEAAAQIELRQALPWSPTHPFLYRVSVRLVSGQKILDEFSGTVGLRSFDICGGDFYLNDRRIVLKAVLDQPFYPNTLSRPPSRDWCRQQVQMIKNAGFNAVQANACPVPGEFLDEADRQGVLVLQQPMTGTICGADRKKLQERLMQQVEGMVRRDRNHPSIVMWGIFSGAEIQDEAELAPALAHRIRELDPTRPILDGVRLGQSLAYSVGSPVGIPYADLGWYPVTPVSEAERSSLNNALAAEGDRLVKVDYGYGGITSFFSVLEAYGKGNRSREDALYFSELGYKVRKSVNSWPLEKKFASFEGFTKALQQGHARAVREQHDLLAADPAVDMLCVAQWRDCVGDSTAGLTDVWGVPKPACEIFKSLNNPTRLIVFPEHASGYIGENTAFEAVLVDETGTKGPAELKVELFDPDGALIKAETYLLTLSGDRVQRFGRQEIGPFRSEGLCKLRATLRYFGTSLGTADADVTAISREATNIGLPLTVYDPDGRLKRYLAAQNLELTDLADTDAITPVVIASQLGDAPAAVVARFFAAVRMGAYGIVLAPPAPEQPLSCSGLLSPQIVGTGPTRLGYFAYIVNHPIFEGLPVSDLLGSADRNVLPVQSMAQSQQFVPQDKWQSLAGAVTGYAGFLGHCLLLKPEGRGTIMLSTFRLIDNLNSDPVAARLLANMVRYAEHSNILTGKLALPQAEVDAVRQEYEELLRQSKKLRRELTLIGPWPLCPESGQGSNFDMPLAPEKTLSLDSPAVTQGLKADWATARLDCRHRLEFPRNFRQKFIVGYACADIESPATNVAQLIVRSRTPIKAWFNGREKYLTRDPLVRLQDYRPTIKEIDSHIRLRKGHNRLLVKFAWSGEPSFLEIRILDHGQELPELNFSTVEAE